MTLPDSARIVPPGNGRWLSWMGHPTEYLAIGSETRERFALSRTTARGQGGPPPHRHDFEEGFYLLRGSLEFLAGNRTVTVGPGEFINVGANVGHAPRNVTGEEVEVLTFVAPAGFDGFQLELGTAIADASGPHSTPSPDFLKRLLEVGPKYKIDMRPPPEAFTVEPNIKIARKGEGRIFAVVGDLYTFLATGDDTAGKYAVWDAVIPPGGGPPLHLHHNEDEAFFVLAGEMTFYADGKKSVATPGTFVHLPPEHWHRFANESNAPAHMLIAVAPAGLEKMFEQIGKVWTDGNSPPPRPTPDEIDRLLAIAPKFGIELRPPSGP